jgi:NADPH-dependent glutamate synthase beta subunit-like oxidoreductase/Pyruvate/2-oxoacid:ferredoxin oxidoreductase delta subunit
MSNQQQPIPTIWTTGWTTVMNTGTWRSQIPVHAWRPSPCHVDCPVSGEIPVWIAQISAGDYMGAWLTLVKHNPFPSVIGRVCHHPCENNCNRQVMESSVGINSLEHFVGDYALQQGWALPAAASAKGKKVAVVGGGPAGLSCAYQLRTLGYDVTLFEEDAELGGLLRHGIPEYRLPKKVADAEIRRVVDMGVQVKAGMCIDTAEKLKALQSDYDAVFLAIGAKKAKRLKQLSAFDKRVMDGLQFLRDVAGGAAPELGRRVVVIGGGSAAMDVARTARRMGKDVTMIALETRETLPAQEEEVVEAMEEGVVLHDGAQVSMVEEEEACLGLTCQKVRLDPDAPIGEFRPIAFEGTDFSLKADNIIVTIGQDPELDAFKQLFTLERGAILTDDEAATGQKGVFAGGDAASMMRYVSTAIGQGERAALAIALYLGDKTVEQRPVSSMDQAVKKEEINLFYFDPMARHERERASVVDRLESFDEVQKVLAETDALDEASRCFSCGACIECDNCFIFCSDMAVKKDSDLPEHYFILDQYCKGCGLCVAECPRGAVTMKVEER